MIAPMLDLADVDKQLDAIGRTPDNLAALVAQHIRAQCSLDDFDRALAEVVQGVTLSQSSIAPSRLPSIRPVAARFSDSPREPSLRATLVEHPSQTAEPPTEESEQHAHAEGEQDADRQADQNDDLDAETAALFGSDSERPTGLTPIAALERPDADTVDGRDASADRSRALEGSWQSPVSTLPEPIAPSQPPKGRWSEPASLPPSQRPKSDFSALLAQDLDPNDFPRTPAPASSPAPAPAAVAAVASDEDEFEMLLDDDELLEIDDDEPSTSNA